MTITVIAAASALLVAPVQANALAVEPSGPVACSFCDDVIVPGFTDEESVDSSFADDVIVPGFTDEESVDSSFADDVIVPGFTDGD
ncbi:hypothetical protein ACIQMR_37130 [Streptomyces sp. NPDC091376]|uniref:hypothetical protein n=1 Tax=Streptomyces sp. NPDC091376 TaxID=3365994 RepID=UPI003816438F